MDVKTILRERAEAWDKMNALRDSAGDRELTAEERQEWDRLEEEISTRTEDYEREQRFERMQSAAREGAGADAESRGLSTSPQSIEDRQAAEDAAFRSWLRGGVEEMTPEQRAMMAERRGPAVPGTEQRAQSVGTNTAGGYFVPPGYWLRISTALKAYGGLLNLGNVLTTDTGQPLQWPNNDDTANVGALLAENTAVTEVDLTIGQRILNAWTYTSNSVLVSLQLLQDSAFDLDTWVPEKLAVRIGRILAAHFITGSGTSQPIGITTTAGGYTPAVGKTGLTGQTLTIIYDDLVDLIHAVDPAYRTGRSQDPTYNPVGSPSFVMHDLSLGIIRKLKDAYGHPLWEPNVQAGNPSTLIGYPVQIDQSMPVMAANALSVAFGNFHEGYVIRQVLGVQMLRLVERYADFLQVGFIGFARYDARPDNGAAFAFYKNSAT